MVPMLGLFYFGQDWRVRDEMAVRAAVENTVDWVVEKGYRHVLMEIGNEVNVARYVHDIIKADRCHELIDLVKTRSQGRVDTPAQRLLVSTSLKGGSIPPDAILSTSDFCLLHGNGQATPT